MPKRNKLVDEHLSVLTALLDDQRNRMSLASPVTKSYESGQYAGLSLALAEFRTRFRPEINYKDLEYARGVFERGAQHIQGEKFDE